MCRILGPEQTFQNKPFQLFLLIPSNDSRTNPWKTEQIVAIHRIFDSGRISLADLSNNFYLPIPVLAAYFISFLALVASCFLVTKVSFRIRSEASERIPKATRINQTAKRDWRPFLGHFLARQKRLTSIGVFVLCAQLFIWFSELFLTNNIKVEV